MGDRMGAVDRAVARIDDTARIGAAVQHVAQLLVGKPHVEQMHWLIYLLTSLGPLGAEPNQLRRATVQIGQMVRAYNAVRRVVELLAESSPAEQVQWVVHVLASLDPCGEPGADRFGETVLRRVKVAVDRRLESGEW